MKAVATYEHTFRLPAERKRVFELFSDPHRLDLVTPDWFRLVPASTVSGELRAGDEIEYRLRWRGVPLRWTSRITDWRGPEYFAYVQETGPYRFFRHEHYFRPAPGGTEVRDLVHFRTPAGRLADRWIARPDLRRIFRCRESRSRRILLRTPPPAAPVGELLEGSEA